MWNNSRNINTEMPRVLRLMTLNLNYRVAKHGAWEVRRALVVDAIRRADADIVALQAVECEDGHSQAAELAALLEYEHVAFIAAVNEGHITRGSAFISHLPISGLTARRLSRHDNHEDASDRVVLRAHIHAGVIGLDIYNAHFSWVEPQALDNARETLAFRSSSPSLLVGDLNSAPSSPPLETLKRAGWVDLWAALRPDDPGYTFEADRPTVRIDYALANADVLRRARAIERVAAKGNAAPRLSDHLGLLITLSDEGEKPH